MTESRTALGPSPIASSTLRLDDVPSDMGDSAALARVAAGYEATTYFGATLPPTAASRYLRARFAAEGRVASRFNLGFLRAVLADEISEGGYDSEVDAEYLEALLVALRSRIAGGPPKRVNYLVERRAEEIILVEEASKGRHPVKLTPSQQRVHGCDVLSYVDFASKDRPHHIEIKGSGYPLLGPDGRFLYGTDVNKEQHARATELEDRWRLEFIGNLAADPPRPPHRLTLTSHEVCDRAIPWKYSVDLEGLEKRVHAG